ncbi:unnamed protein product [Trichobilharzia szidati]|nr:unnamed protein product [Trichobilharzia szidati]
MNPMCISLNDCDPYHSEYVDIKNLPIPYTGRRQYNKPIGNRQFNNPQHIKRRTSSNSASQRRRFSSVENNNKQSFNGTHQIIRRNQSGWYQTDYITRNQSLEPRLPTYEPLLTYSESDLRTRKRRRNRKNRHGSRHLYLWHNNGRFPLPQLLATPLGLMRQLPFSRLHHDSFRRMFPTMMTKTMRDRKERIQAAKELPFSKYSDNQLQDLFLISQPSNETTVKDPSTVSPPKWDQMKKKHITHHKEDLQKVDNIADKVEMNLDEITEPNSIDFSEFPNEEQETEKSIHVIEKDDSNQFDKYNHKKIVTPVSEEFLTISETEDKQPSNHTNEDEPNRSEDKNETENILPFIDTDQEVKHNLEKNPLAVNDEITHSEDLRSHPSNQQDVNSSEYGDHTTSESWKTNPYSESQSKNYLDKRKLSKLHKPSPVLEQRDIISDYYPEPETEVTVPPPQVTASLFESASVGQMTGPLTCRTCGQPAYPAERFETDGVVFHIACFKCHNCACMLQRGTWNQRGSNYYCNPCHRRIALQTLRH